MHSASDGLLPTPPPPVPMSQLVCEATSHAQMVVNAFAVARHWGLPSSFSISSVTVLSVSL